MANGYPCHTVPHPAIPCHTRDTLRHTRAKPCHTLPNRAIPCHTRAKPCHTVPYPAKPCHTLPYPAIPCYTVPYPAIPCHTMPNPAIPCPTLTNPLKPPQICPNPLKPSQTQMSVTSTSLPVFYLIFVKQSTRVSFIEQILFSAPYPKCKHHFQSEKKNFFFLSFFLPWFLCANCYRKALQSGSMHIAYLAPCVSPKNQKCCV